MRTLIWDWGLKSSTWETWIGIRVIRKARKTQHQNPEFGHTQGEIFFCKPAKKYIKLKKTSILVVN
jgi:hypothetical protein